MKHSIKAKVYPKSLPCVTPLAKTFLNSVLARKNAPIKAINGESGYNNQAIRNPIF